MCNRLLDDAASRCSGVSLERARGLNGRKLYEELGDGFFAKLAGNFYERVFADDEEPWFRNQFTGTPKEEAIQKLYEWLVQRCGGPELYSERRGHPGLGASHGNFDVSQEGSHRWVMHMTCALAETPAATHCADAKEAKEVLLDFLAHMAHFLSAMQRKRDGKNVLGKSQNATRKRRQEATAAAPPVADLATSDPSSSEKTSAGPDSGGKTICGAPGSEAVGSSQGQTQSDEFNHSKRLLAAVDISCRRQHQLLWSGVAGGIALVLVGMFFHRNRR